MQLSLEILINIKFRADGSEDSIVATLDEIKQRFKIHYVRLMKMAFSYWAERRFLFLNIFFNHIVEY